MLRNIYIAVMNVLASRDWRVFSDRHGFRMRRWNGNAFEVREPEGDEEIAQVELEMNMWRIK